jgi:O-antigen ligase
VQHGRNFKALTTQVPAVEQRTTRLLVTVSSVCLITILAVSSFGEIQSAVLPLTLERLLYVIACAGLGAVILAEGMIGAAAAATSFAFLFGILGILFGQSLWREDVGGVATKALASALLFGLLACSPGLTPPAFLRALRASAVVGILASAVLISFTSLGTKYVFGDKWFVGWFEHKNYLGLCSAVGCAALIACAVARRRLDWVSASLIAVSFALLVLSHSRGAQFWLAVFLACFFSPLFHIRVARSVCVVLIFSAGAVIFLVSASDAFLQRFQGITTGRTSVWIQARALIETAPWLGSGFGVSYSSGGPSFFDDFGNVFKGVHNGYLTLLVDAGILGLLIYAGVIGCAMWSAGRSRTVEREALMSMAAAFVAFNLVESAVDKVTHLSFVFYPILLASCVQVSRRATGHVQPTGDRSRQKAARV